MITRCDSKLLSFNFKNEPFCCHVSPKSSNSTGEFRGENLSNNHLLVASEKIREQIYSMHSGDQIRLNGMLINYSMAGGDFVRNSSTIRTDEGNGACEVVFVEGVQVLGRWKLRSVAAKATLFLGIVTFLSWFVGPIWAYEKRNRETDLMEENYRKRMGGR